MTDAGLAVVTGASSGIGRELARELRRQGYALVVAAEDTGIDRVGAELAAGDAAVTTVRADLSTPAGVEKLWRAITATGRPVDIAALNAGIGAGGRFARETSLEDELRMIDLNVRSTVHLAKLVVGQMAGRGEGRILFTSSVAATTPGTFQAVYSASKSFVQSFALALRAELADTGVTVTSLTPGPTDTAFFERAGMDDTALAAGASDDPADVAEQAVAALLNGDERVVTATLATRVEALASRLLPDSVKAAALGLVTRPGSSPRAG